MRLILIAALIATICGCAEELPPPLQVQPYGPGRYLASYSSIFGPGKAAAAAVRDANEYCSRLGTYMTPLDHQTAVGPISSYEFLFACGPVPGGATPPLGPDVVVPRPRRAPAPVAPTGAGAAFGQPVYDANECIGAVVNGVCHGSVIDTNPARPRCYGTMLNGQCTGPMF